ncbi:MAG TPA: hypothetical protein VFX29_02040 [Longimicrobiaceae bacterium]|jgi:hypothetical protein|nr:hypothetical protein [Longimicrobiaceae bacterium]
MIYEFPHDTAYLPRTRLSYINLPGLLSDGKRDRTARVPGYVAIHLGDRCYLIFLRAGEPFHAALLTPSMRRAVAVTAVLRVVAEQVEHGEQGSIGYYGASEAQLRTMLGTLLHAPLPADPAGPADPDRLFAVLGEERFDGTVELFEDDRFHYLCFEHGALTGGYFAERADDALTGDRVRALFDPVRPPRIARFAGLTELPVQAAPGLVELYRRLLHGVAANLGEHTGADAAWEALRLAQIRVQPRHPAIAAFRILPGARLAGDPAATPAELTAGVAAWLVEALGAATDRAGIDPGELLEQTAHDHRFVLAEHGFFGHIPWPVVL